MDVVDCEAHKWRRSKGRRMDKSLDVSLASVVEVRAADISARERREWSWLLLGDEFAMVGSRA
jgi:hypothetical protein